MWPDVEETFIGVLAAALGVRVADTVPDNVEQLPGFIRVTRGPGGDDFVTDSPLVDIEAFHPIRGEASLLAERARQAMINASSRPGVLVDSVATTSGPTWVFYAPSVHRYVASYRVALRRPR